MRIEGAVAPLTTARQVLTLSRAEAESQIPVRLDGVITCYVPGSALLFVQDETGGAYVMPMPWPKELHLGDAVTVEGLSGQGLFSPIIQFGTLTRTGERRMIEPRSISLESLNRGQYDCDWITLEAVVRSQSGSPDNTRLLLANGSSHATALIFGPQEQVKNLVDARVRLTGVAGTFYEERKLSGFGLFLHDSSLVEVIQPPPEDPFAAPLRPTDSLAWFSPEGRLEHRIRVRGTVTFASGRTVFLQDQAGPAKVNLAETPSQGLEPGKVVEAAGFVADPTGRAELEHSLIRIVGDGPPAEPLSLARTQSLGEEFAFQRISVNAWVLEQAKGGEGGVAISLERNGEFFTAHVSGADRDVLPGSLVKATGIWIPPEASEGGKEHGLWAGSASGLRVLEKPAGPRPSLSFVAAVVSSASLLGAAVLFLGLLQMRRQVAQARTARRSLEEKAGEAERQLQVSNAARERLGRDLHDHIIQSIYALGLKVDDCTQQIGAQPERAKARLQSVLDDVNAVIRDLRNVILGIESNSIQPQEFKTALKSLALTLSQDQPGRIRLDIDQAAAELLSPDQATELVHIVREAVSNSLRHGNAQATTVRLVKLDGHLRLLVEDDGKGFNTRESQSTGFGLRNMARRAENMAATFEVRSEKGKGTIIMLDIPRQKQHF